MPPILYNCNLNFENSNCPGALCQSQANVIYSSDCHNCPQYFLIPGICTAVLPAGELLLAIKSATGKGLSALLEHHQNAVPVLLATAPCNAFHKYSPSPIPHNCRGIPQAGAFPCVRLHPVFLSVGVRVGIPGAFGGCSQASPAREVVRFFSSKCIACQSSSGSNWVTGWLVCLDDDYTTLRMLTSWLSAGLVPTCQLNQAEACPV